jgi:AcrR family transcriptional regulator
MRELPVIQPAHELPVLPQGEPVERADAARNRARILCAAQRLFAERGAGCVSMDEVADAAGVGKGTLFRRFGSRAELAQAVLSEHEIALQEGMIRGEPPLGPGAQALERLVAFGEARLQMLDSQAELLVSAEPGPVRYVSAPHGVHRLHVMLLLRELDPGCDAELLAETLLAALSAELFIYLRDVRGLGLERIKAGWRETVERLAPPPRAPSPSEASADPVPAA